jgi:hypothetical protein
MAETCNGLLMVEFEAETVEELTPETAPPVPESGPHAPTSVQLATGRMAGQPNRLLRWALGLAAVFGGVVVSDFGPRRERTIDRLFMCRCDDGDERGAGSA